jgi:hypothetical protein
MSPIKTVFGTAPPTSVLGRGLVRGLLFLVVLVLMWCALIALVSAIGNATGSGLGSCGLYGDSASLVVIGLAGFVSTPVAAYVVTRRLLRRWHPPDDAPPDSGH